MKYLSDIQKEAYKKHETVLRYVVQKMYNKELTEKFLTKHITIVQIENEPLHFLYFYDYNKINQKLLVEFDVQFNGYKHEIVVKCPINIDSILKIN